MDKFAECTIKAIKLQESNTEAKLKENRDLEIAISSLNRNIQAAIAQIEKSRNEQIELTKRIDKLRCQLELSIIRRDALLAQTEVDRKELEELKQKSAEGVSFIWNLRSSVCSAVQKASDSYDILALLMKPISVVPSPQVLTSMVKVEYEYEDRLKETIKKRDAALAERERLLNEPETGQEFIRSCFRRHNIRSFSSRNVEINENDPIKFSTSGAAVKKTIRPIKTPKTDMPWYQPYCIVGSIAVFLIYFCILREENDVDVEFTKTLYERIKGLEKTQLMLSYKHNKEQGLSVDDIEKRLKEIEEEEAKELA